jgi:flagellar basal-body rod protein FlgF
MSSIKNVYILASKMMSQRKHLDVVGNNVANVNTNGYKKMEMDFSSLVSKKNGTDVGVFVKQEPLRIDFSAGNLAQTQNPLDMALHGEGMFAVNVNGATEYTRNGHFLLDGEGNLITEQGHPVLDGNFAAINIPAGAKQVTVTKEGTIATENGPLVDIGVFNFTEDSDVINVGQGRYRSSETAIISETPHVLQGMLEDANVQAVEETVRLTELMRSYQNAAQLISRVEEVESRAVRDLSRIPN